MHSEEGHTGSVLSQFQMLTVSPGAHFPLMGTGAIMLATLHITFYLCPCKSSMYFTGSCTDTERLKHALPQATLWSVSKCPSSGESVWAYCLLSFQVVYVPLKLDLVPIKRKYLLI